MSAREPCLCGAEDCRYCYPQNFVGGRYIDREAIAEQEAKELHELRLQTLEKAIDLFIELNMKEDSDVLAEIYHKLQKEGA
jgi:hypothetical protein